MELDDELRGGQAAIDFFAEKKEVIKERRNAYGGHFQANVPKYTHQRNRPHIATARVGLWSGPVRGRPRSPVAAASGAGGHAPVAVIGQA